MQGGNYLLQLMDTYCTGWGLLIIALVECIAVSWVYGQSFIFSAAQESLSRTIIPMVF